MPFSWKKFVEENQPDRLPIDVRPYSNEEYIPRPPSKEEKAIMQVAMEDCDRAARYLGMPRRRFLQTAAAYAICIAAINKIRGGGYALAQEGQCDLTATLGQQGPDTPIEFNFWGAQMNNLPGEFIFDLQTHHMDSGDPAYRATNPGYQAFTAAAFGRQQCKFGEEIDPIECVSRFHYLKELYLDSSTNMCVLSAVPYQPDGQPLPLSSAFDTTQIVNNFAGTRRQVMHRFVMPNRGSAGTKSDSRIGNTAEPLFLQEELDLMEESALRYGGADGPLRAWKVYTPWGDVPYSSGWWLDDPAGRKFLDHVAYLAKKYDMPSLVCAHKGFALPTFEQDKAATRDVGVVARDYWMDRPEDERVTFIIYHTGYDGDSASITAFSPSVLLTQDSNQGTSTASVYPLDVTSDGTLALGQGSDEDVRSIDRGVDNFIKSLRENGWSSRNFATGGTPGQPGHTSATDKAVNGTGDGDPDELPNVPNVYAELGSVWAATMNDPVRSARLMGKLVYYVGPRRIVWGTDALWGGSPQPEISTFRTFNMRSKSSPEVPASDNADVRAIADLYKLPFGLDTDRFDTSKDTTNPGDYPVGTSKAQRHARSIRNGVFGYNAAEVYRIPEAEVQAATDPQHAIACDQVQSIRDQYIINPTTPNPDAESPGPLAKADPQQMDTFRQIREEYRRNPMNSNTVNGPRTRRELFASLRKDPWHRGARKMQNEKGFLKKFV